MRPRNLLLEAKVLAVAARLFSKDHYFSVRMDDIAAEASVGKATLYRYFADKEQLYIALLEHDTNELLQRLTTATKRHRPNVRAKLIAIIAVYFDYLFGHPHMGPMIVVNEALLGRASPWQRARDEGIRLILECFSQAAEIGEFKVRDPQYAAMMIAGGLRWVYYFGKRAKGARLATNLINTLLDGAIIRDENRDDR